MNPGIVLRREGAGYGVEQHRPAAGTLLARLDLERALERVTTLLPICGEAQRIAATRAIEAARGATEPPALTARRDDELLTEQIQTSIWRMCVDWPGLLGEERNLAGLRLALRSRDLETLRALLRDHLDGLHEADSAEDLARWLDRGQCVAARAVAAGAETDRQAGNGAFARAEPGVPSPGSGLSGSAQPSGLSERSGRTPEAVLMLANTEGFWPGNGDAFAPPPGEVGAAVMARHPLTPGTDGPYGPVARRLLAQALDAAFLTAADPGSAGLHTPGGAPVAHRRKLARVAGEGIGWAMTARGPLVHRVVLAEAAARRALRWEVLAPTDWHFAADGPIARGLAEADVAPSAVRWFVAGFDPCAAWSVDAGDRDR